MKITIETVVHAPIDKVWAAWDHARRHRAVERRIRRLAHHESIRRPARRRRLFLRMEAKDGSMGFDFAGIYTKVVPNALIESSFGERTLQVEFVPGADGVTVRETFDAEETHSVEQRSGWQAILDRFARHVEGKG